MSTQSKVHIALVGGAPLVSATFVARPNRFLVEATLEDGSIVQAHLADRGRLLGKLVPDAKLILGHKPGTKRKTQYQVAGVYLGPEFVSLDTVLPNRLIEAALKDQKIAPFADYQHIEREVKIEQSRFDFGLAQSVPENGKRLREACPCIVEVKSVGDVDKRGVAIFPDAPTTRGRRHLLELAELYERGTRTAVIFVIQRGDGRAVAVNREIDPAFADTLADVAKRGVELYAYRCPLTLSGITLKEPVEVLLTYNQHT